MAETEGEEDSSTTEHTEVRSLFEEAFAIANNYQTNKFMVPDLLPSSQSRLQRTSHPSPSLQTPETARKRVLGVEASSQEVVDSVEAVATHEEVEVSSKESVKAVEDNRASMATTTGVVAVLRVEDDDSAGRTTTSHREIAMLRSTLSQTGRCWRRLTSTVLPS